jgi:glycosyltransferase involved in cell wall biosynthesis
MNKIEISVIIPTYNRPDLLIRAAYSAIKQSRVPDELIIIDDKSRCSYENTLEKVERFGQEAGVEVKYHRLNDPMKGGACAARNKGTELASGDIYMFLDDDDTWNSRKVSGQTQIFLREPNVGLVYCGRQVVDEQNRALYKIRPSKKGDLSNAILTKNLIGTTSSVAIRSEIFEKVGGFDENMPALQDYDLWIRVSRETTIEFDPDCTVQWRIDTSSNSQMTSNPKIYHEAFRRISNKYRLEFKQLSTSKKRMFASWKYSVLSDKYARNISVKQYVYACRSIIQYPTVSGFAKLVPISVQHSIRGFLDL